MSGISSGVGLISGINYQSLITQLVALDQVPQNIVQSQINETNEENDAFATLSTALNDLQTISNQLQLPETFQSAVTSSTNPSVLTATAAQGAAVGSYQFQVAQLVTTQQTITNGFANSTTAPVGAGVITIEEGGGQAFSQTPLSQLNGGAGVQRGQFRITDGSGNSAVINTADAVTVDDVINDINSANGINVHASLSDQGIVLTDNSGETSHDLTVQDLSGGAAAASLGIAGDAGTGQTVLNGSAIDYIGDNTQLGTLNDGLGVRTAATGDDFQVNLSDGSNFQVTLGSSQTVGDVINAINTAGAGKIQASIASGGQGIQLLDTSGGGSSPFTVTALNGSDAAGDLGILQSGAGTTITGTPVLASLDSVLLSSLRGGAGLPLGQISITDKAGTAALVNLAGASSLSDILSDINNSTLGSNVTASLNSAGTGIQLNDTSTGTGTLAVTDVNSASAALLGLTAAATNNGSTLVGVNLQHQYINQNTLLSTLGGGQGVTLGTFSITNSTGATENIDLTQGTVNTVGDVINTINKASLGVTASINANGNGILLTDTAGGSGKLKVTDVSGSSAENLNIAGTATGTTIDGAYQKTITVSKTDTLSSVQTAINNLGFGVTAQIVNDGSSTNPFRLALTSANSGAAGTVIIDGGATNLNPTTLVQGQDAAVFLGGSGSAQPLLLTSNTNQLTNVIKGVTINLTGASSSPVTLNVTLDPTAVTGQIQNFVTEFNAITNGIGTLTQFNSTTNQGGLLLGDPTAQQIEQVLYNFVDSSVSNAGQFNSLQDVGITIGDNAQLSFDTNTFTAAFAADPTAVQTLFSQTTTTINPTTGANQTTGTGLGYVISNAINSLTDPVSGIVTLAENTLTTRASNYQTYFNELNALVLQKQTLLETQFTNLEVNLASLQSQQQVLSSFTSAAAATAASEAASTPAANSSSSSSSNASDSSSSSSSG